MGQQRAGTHGVLQSRAVTCVLHNSRPTSTCLVRSTEHEASELKKAPSAWSFLVRSTSCLPADSCCFELHHPALPLVSLTVPAQSLPSTRTRASKLQGREKRRRQKQGSERSLCSCQGTSTRTDYEYRCLLLQPKSSCLRVVCAVRARPGGGKGHSARAQQKKLRRRGTKYP